ncbi:tetratricopeptide-like helical domain-containing protein [Tanacetum coccineum]
MERVQDRIGNCKNKSLSFSGRLQLIISAHAWFPLVWWSMKRGKSKVAEVVCLPKHEGGLGIRMYLFRSNICWGWRKILQIFNVLRPHIWYCIGNGKTTSMWDDLWDELCPLIQHVTPRNLIGAGFNRNDKMADVLKDGNWSWPNDWAVTHPTLFHINPPLLVLRVKTPLLGKLKMVNSCLLVSLVFGIVLDQELDDIIEWLLLIAHKNSIKSIVARLVFAAATYFIRQERNNRIHGKEARRVNQIRDTIVKVVRMKLMTIRFKKNLNVTRMFQIWKISKGDLHVSTNSCCNVKYVNHTKLSEALNVFNKMTHERPLPLADEFIRLLKDMKRHDMYFYKTGVVSFKPLFDRLILENRIYEAQGLFKQLAKHELCQLDTVLYNTIIKALCSHPFYKSNASLASKMMDDALKLLIEMLRAYCNAYKMDEAMLLYLEMNERGFKPDHETYSIMIRKLFRVARSGEALKVLEDMRAQGQMLNAFTYFCILNDLINMGHLEEALSLFHFVGDDGKLNSDISVFYFLINAAFVSKKSHIATELFEDLSVKGMKT